MVPTTAIASHLAEDSGILAIAGSRIYDYDIRRAGPRAVQAAFSGDGDIQPAIMVADAGGGRDSFSRSDAVFSDRAYIWFFAPPTANGRDQVDTLVNLVQLRLRHWQHPASGVIVTLGERIGCQLTEAPRMSYMDRLVLRVQGVIAGVQL